MSAKRGIYQIDIGQMGSVDPHLLQKQPPLQGLLGCNGLSIR